jgi:hypothetical protein
LACILACTKTPHSATSEDRDLARGLGLSDSTLQLIASVAGGPLAAIRPIDSAGQLLPPAGLAFGLPTAQVAPALARLRASLGAHYQVFETDRGYTYHPDTIGIIRSDDPNDMLRGASTSGVNYDIFTDSIIALVGRWSRAYGFRLQAAGGDWMEGAITPTAEQWKDLAQEVYKVCPDVVDQGTNTVEALEAEMRKTGLLYCWWD